MDRIMNCEPLADYIVGRISRGSSCDGREIICAPIETALGKHRTTYMHPYKVCSSAGKDPRDQ